MKGRYITRDMQAVDLHNILTIEKNAQPSPWARLSFEESLTRKHVCRVICESNNSQEIVAYHVVCPVADELHILNLVVAKPSQGKGIAHMLLHDIVAIAEDKTEIRKIFLEVRIGNEVAKNLYSQWQFKQIAVRDNYYRVGNNQAREDALVLVKVL